MFEKLKILDEKDKRLRKKSKEVTFPISNEYKELIDKIINELTLSQIEEEALKLELRPGMGLAFPQLGIDARIIIVVHEYDDGLFDNYILINPKVVSTSKEMIAAEAGEGCLSVSREVDGHILRHARITIEGYAMDGTKIRIRAREELAIAFQHEVDHLEGILFFDRIDKNRMFYTDKEIRLI